LHELLHLRLSLSTQLAKTLAHASRPFHELIAAVLNTSIFCGVKILAPEPADAFSEAFLNQAVVHPKTAEGDREEFSESAVPTCI
jgi:hypothetical protein